MSEKLTNIILIYSALGIFLLSLVRDVLNADFKSSFYYLFFALFSILLAISLFYFIRMILPAGIAYLDPPRKYYAEFRSEMEKLYPGDESKVNDSLKGSYIMELEDAIANNLDIFHRKSSFFYNALLFALLAVTPYITCVCFHLAKKETDIQKIEMTEEKKQ